MYAATSRTCSGVTVFERVPSSAFDRSPVVLYWHAPASKWFVAMGSGGKSPECTGANGLMPLSTLPSGNLSLLDGLSPWNDPGVSVTCGITAPMPPPPPLPPSPPWPPYGSSVTSSASCGAPGVNLIEVKARP